jgi:hypothetical protein
VTPKTLTVTGITAAPKTYDGNTTATLGGTAVINGTVGTDVVTLNTAGETGTFNSKDVTTATSVSVTGLTLTGADANNYTIAPVTIADHITPAPLTITGLTVAPKTYDGTTTATINGTPVLNGVIPADTGNVTVTGTPVGTFNSPNVTTATTVTVTGLSLTGSSASNYTLPSTTIAATITPAELTVTATGPTKASGTALTAGPSTTDFTATGTVGGEQVTSVTLTPDANGLSAATPAGSPYVVTPSAATGTGGFAVSNYSITYVPFNGTVDSAPITPAGPATFTAFDLFQANDKVNKIIYETLSPFQLSSNVHEPLVFFYHPLTPVDQSAFNDIALDEGAYDFIENSLELKKLPPSYYGVQ